jgi:spore maturation protein SpmA
MAGNHENYRGLGLIKLLARFIAPVMHWLFPEVPRISPRDGKHVDEYLREHAGVEQCRDRSGSRRWKT